MGFVGNFQIRKSYSNSYVSTHICLKALTPCSSSSCGSECCCSTGWCGGGPSFLLPIVSRQCLNIPLYEYAHNLTFSLEVLLLLIVVMVYVTLCP